MSPGQPRFRWDIAEFSPREHWQAFPDVHPLVVQLLWNRGIREPSAITAFLSAEALATESVWSMTGVEEAVERILRARDAGETVAVYGDYDADGISSTTLLVECFRDLGIPTIPFIPHRERDGYGLNAQALTRLRDVGATLVVAVDCGISGAPEVEHARAIGLDTIVVDHHHVPATLPAAIAVINPHQPGCEYPFKGLCGVGLAYKLAGALLTRAGRDPDEADRWLDLVALGTVADIAALRGENRSLVLRGIATMRPPRRPGLLALARVAGLTDGLITAESIGFALGPRLNAAGRLAEPDVSLRLLLCTSESDARALAEQLDRTNRERQDLTRGAVDRARTEISIRQSENGGVLPKLLMIVGEGYPAGVVGLVAARLAEEFRRPTLIAELNNGVIRGSARSISGFHITNALTNCGDLLVRFGGHAMAAGFTAMAANASALQGRLERIAELQLSDDDVEPRLVIDAPIQLKLHQNKLFQIVSTLDPFGAENPRPLFVSRRLKVAERRVVGQGAPGHLKLTLIDGHTRWDAIGFGMGERLSGVSEHIDIVYSVERNNWNGQSSDQLRLLDFQTSIASA